MRLQRSATYADARRRMLTSADARCSACTNSDGGATILAQDGMYAVIVSAEGHMREEALLTLTSRDELAIRMSTLGVQPVDSLQTLSLLHLDASAPASPTTPRESERRGEREPTGC